MAGLGFKDFQVGEVLTSADVDGYLMQQTVMRFADAGARGSALGTASGTAVALAEGMVSYLDDQNAVEVYNGSVWRSVSNVQQVVFTELATTFSEALASGGESADLMTATITPVSTSSRILIMAHIGTMNNSRPRAIGNIRFYRDSTRLAPADVSNRPGVNASTLTPVADAAVKSSVAAFQLDSPSTTSAVTYRVRAVNTDSFAYTIYVNRTASDSDFAFQTRTSSTLTLMELLP